MGFADTVRKIKEHPFDPDVVALPLCGCLHCVSNVRHRCCTDQRESCQMWEPPVPLPGARDPQSPVDKLVDAQLIENRAKSDMCDIVSIPAGAKLLRWAYLVKATWWYRLFSKIDPRLRGTR